MANKAVENSAGGMTLLYTTSGEAIDDAVIAALDRKARAEPARLTRLRDAKPLLERLTRISFAFDTTNRWLTIPDPVVAEMPEVLELMKDLKESGNIDYEYWPETPATLAVYDVDISALSAM